MTTPNTPPFPQKPNLLDVPKEMSDLKDDQANAAANRNAAERGMPPIDFVAELKKMKDGLPALTAFYGYNATRMMEKYKALRAAGFDEQQALYITAQKD